ncbi:MAG: TonB-dependent receptor, partial [Cyanobacteria bacterium P01_F01_bin.3]
MPRDNLVRAIQASCIALLVGTTTVSAGQNVADQTFELDIPAKPLTDALVDFSKSTNIAVLTADIGNSLEGVNSRKLLGQYNAVEALEALLSGYGLQYEFTSDETIIIRPVSSGPKLQRASFKTIDYTTTVDYGANSSAYDGNQSADDVDTVRLDEILVTASRRAQRLQDVPMSITSINPEEFVAVGLTSLEDVIDYTPGVNFNGDGQPGQGTVTMRAVSQESSIPVTAIYVDDVPLTTSTPFAFGAGVLLDGLLGDLERVEVIKGPQGTLYGASAMGGVIRYITKDPALEQLRGRVSADLSTTKEGGSSQLYRGMVSIPIIKDKAGLTVSGFYNDRGGFIDRLDPFTLEVAQEDFDESEIYGVSATGLFRFSDKASLRLSALNQSTEAFGAAAVRFNVVNADEVIADPNVQAILEPLNGDYNVAVPDPGFNNLEYTKADATFKYGFDWGEFTSVTGYAKYVNEQLSDVITGNEATIDFLTGSPPGTSQSVPSSAEAGAEKFVQEFRLSSSNNESLEWQVGLFYSRDNTNNIQFITAEPQGIILNNSRFPADYEETAAFGNVTYYLTPDFDVTAGLRYSDTSFDADFNFGGLVIESLAGQFGTSESVTTYMFNARWRVQDNRSLYARIASGYRPGYVNTPVNDRITGQVASTTVRSDTLWSYEVGAKGNEFDGRFSYDLALWAMDWDDFQATLSLSGVATGGNAGVSQSSYGFEGTFNLLLTDNFRIQNTVAYTESTLDDDSVVLGAVDGEETRRLPDWTASLRAGYDYNIGDIDASIGFGVRYVGELSGPYIGDVTRGIGFGRNRDQSFGDVVLAD